MVSKVYTPKEVSDVLSITEVEVLELLRQGELQGFLLLSKHWRIPEEALKDLMGLPSSGSSASQTPRAPMQEFAQLTRAVQPTYKKRNRNPSLEKEWRNWALTKVREKAPDLLVHSRRSFTAGGKQGILAVATTTTGPYEVHWFGFNERLLQTDFPAIIVAVLADEEIAFVIPYLKNRTVFDMLSRDRRGDAKFNIEKESGNYRLTGSGANPELDLAPYLNAFHLF